jgi:nitrate/nitrite transporter NarK
VVITYHRKFFSGGGSALLIVLIFEIKGVGSTYGGTAIGLASTMGMVGAFFAPPLGNSLSDTNLGLPFIFWAILSALSLLGFLFIEERRKLKGEVKSDKSEVKHGKEMF